MTYHQTHRTTITEEQYERMADARVIRRLDTDRLYNNAESADEQKAREEQIERDVCAALDAEFVVTR